MKDFPKSFAQAAQTLNPEDLTDEANTALQDLHDKGYDVLLGLTEDYAVVIRQMCQQPSIKEYCPNDAGRRFADRAATEKWLSKGRAAFLLVRTDTKELAGYGWSGPELSQHVPGAEATFAIRIGEADQGKGLSTPYLRVIVGATQAMFGAAKIWLETWASDAAASHIYKKIGFEEVDQMADKRPAADGQAVDDTRMYMTLPD